METIVIKGHARTDFGKKSSKKIRSSGNVPCVMYGGKEIIHFYTGELALKKIVFTPYVYLLKMNLNGKEHNALLQDVQFHPVTDKIIHIDFKEISFDHEVDTYLPVKLTGDSIGIKAGGKLRQKRRKLKVRALPTDLPSSLEIDLTDLEIGDSFKVGDLSYDKLTLLDPHRSMVVAVVSSRIAKGMEEELPEAEGEVEEAEGEEAGEGEEAAATSEETSATSEAATPVDGAKKQ